MSGLDSAARGLATRALTATATRSRVLMAAGQSGPIYGGTGAGFVSAHQATIPANAILGGATLRFRMLMAKYPPFNASHNWRLRFSQGANSVVAAQNSLGASLATFEADQHLSVAGDRKSGFAFSRNALNAAAIASTGMIASTGATTGGTSTLGARQPASAAMFVSYTAPPTVETVLIDFTQPVTVSVDVQAVNGDTIEVLGATLEMLASGDVPRSFASSRATAVWGDSLTEGTGAVPVGGVPMDYVAQLRRQRPGWPIAAKGLGGQKAQAIVDRLVADGIGGKLWNAVLWAGINDVASTNGGADWWNAVRTQIDRALAYRTNPATIVCTYHPNAAWMVGDATYAALQYVNAQLAGTYGSRVCDLFGVLATASGKVPLAIMNAVTTTGTIAAGSTALTVASATGIVVGQYAISPGSTAISDGSTASAPMVTAVSGTTVTLSASAGAALSGAAISFVGSSEVHLNDAGYTLVMQAIDAKMTALGWS